MGESHLPRRNNKNARPGAAQPGSAPDTQGSDFWCSDVMSSSILPAGDFDR